jgi:CheY-like chemotaxis protein
MTVLRAPDVRVLVVDDDEFALNIACKYLKLMEIKTRTVNSGTMALKAVTNGKYDIVFIDHLMPEMDGIETMLKIRELGGRFEELTLIALTGSGQENAREMFISKGFTDFVSKPLNVDELYEVIKKHLPPEKIELQSAEGNVQTHAKEDEHLIIDFVKNNRETFGKIKSLLDSSDIKTAHRTAHNLKSAAGYLKKKELQAAAFSLETSLGREPPEYTAEQLTILEKELSAALSEFEPLLVKAESQKAETVQVSSAELTAIFAELMPLLEKSDFGATRYVEKLQGIAGMEKLAELIENYEFTEALKIIQSI